MKNDLKTLREIIEYYTQCDLSDESRTNEIVFARALYYGIADELFVYSHRELAETIGKKRLTALHAINNVYPHLSSYKPIYESMKYSIIETLDSKLNTKYIETYQAHKFKPFIQKLNSLPTGIAEAVVERFETIIDIEMKKFKNITVKHETL